MDNPTRFRNLPSDLGAVNNTSVERLRPELRASAEAVRKHIRDGFLATGRELRWAREKCKYGEWTPYLGAVGISRSGAFEVMKAAAAVDSGMVPADLSLRGVLARLRKVRRSSIAQTYVYRPTGPVMDSDAVDAEVARLRQAEGRDWSIDACAHLAMTVVHVRQTGRVPSPRWFEDNPCSYCDCFPAGTTMREQVEAWHEGRGPDPWKCPKGDRRWHCEAAGDASIDS